MRSSARLKELAEAPLGRLLFKYSWPALVAMTLNALYSVVDRFWIGRGAGEDAMAALTLSIPIMMVFGAFGVWIGAGHSAVLSIKLGEGDHAAAERTLGELVAFKLIFFVLLPPIVFVLLDPILQVPEQLLGGDPFGCLSHRVFTPLLFCMRGWPRHRRR